MKFDDLWNYPPASVIASVLSLSLSLWTPAAQAETQQGFLSNFGDPHFQAAVAKPLSTPPDNWTGVFRWLQIGDSHTAGDYLTGEVRRRLQLRYGDGGVGWITPGYVLNQRSESVKLSNEDNWSVRRAARGPEPFIPFGGFLASTNTPGAWMRLTFKNPTPRQLLRVSLLQPTAAQFAGSLEADSGGATAPVPHALGNPGWKMTSVLLDGGDDKLFIRNAPLGSVAGSGLEATALGGLALERLAPGAVVDAVGANGAQIDEFLGWDEDATAAALAARPPNLVILAYGTNESVARNFDRDAFFSKVTTAVRRLRRLSNAAILLVSPPDMRLADKNRRSRQVGCGQPPENQSQVNSVLSSVARQEKTLLWDWGRWVRAQGANCGTVSLAYMTPALARPDFVHLTPEGYQASGASLLNDLLQMARVSPF